MCWGGGGFFFLGIGSGRGFMFSGLGVKEKFIRLRNVVLEIVFGS